MGRELTNLTKREREALEEARSSLYKPGQYRLWIERRKIKGPVRLIDVKFVNEREIYPGVEADERLWQCELMWCDEVRLIGEYDLGIEVNEMEAIAWASI